MLRFINETNEGRRGTLVLLMLANALQKLLPVCAFSGKRSPGAGG